MTQERKKNIFSLIPVLVMMGIIFLFSAKTAVQSNQSSSVLVQFTYDVYHTVLGQEDQALGRENFDTVNYVIRKLAHMTEYGILAVLMAIHLCTRHPGRYRFFIWNIGFCVLYAMSDEFHQTFVPGRSGSLVDVFIDSIGIIVGTVIFYLARRKQFATS